MAFVPKPACSALGASQLSLEEVFQCLAPGITRYLGLLWEAGVHNACGDLHEMSHIVIQLFQH